MMKSIWCCAAALLGLLGAPRTAQAQSEGFDSTAVAAAYHKLSGDTLDLEAAARAQRVRAARDELRPA